MNILFIKHFFVGFMVSEIPIVSVFGHCPYSVTFPYRINPSLYLNGRGVLYIKTPPLFCQGGLQPHKPNPKPPVPAPMYAVILSILCCI